MPDDAFSLPSEGWLAVAEEAKLKQQGGMVVKPKGLSMLLLFRQGEVFALDDRCAHLGCALAGGKIEGYTLSCPCHEWRYDIRTGEFLDAPVIKIARYDCRVEGGKVLVKV
jgi:nitrite reductase/ring-hydroxylating ferredoxin subunit